jgi:hypothetical protein
LIVSVHIAQLGPLRVPGVLRGGPTPADTPGLRYAETALTARLGAALPAPRLGAVALIAAWDDDASLGRFLAESRHAERFADGWEIRMAPLRVFGSWPRMPGLPKRELPVDDAEPLAALTLGRPRLGRIVPFLRTSRPAETDAVGDPALLAATGLARPPRLVSTFTVWSSAAAMRDYARRQGGAHRSAIHADRERPFHHESAFIRLRPYLSRGRWEGRDPLPGLRRPAPV